MFCTIIVLLQYGCWWGGLGVTCLCVETGVVWHFCLLFFLVLIHQVAHMYSGLCWLNLGNFLFHVKLYLSINKKYFSSDKNMLGYLLWIQYTSIVYFWELQGCHSFAMTKFLTFPDLFPDPNSDIPYPKCAQYLIS